MQIRIAVLLQNNGTHELVSLVSDLGAKEIALQLEALEVSADVNIHGESLRTIALHIMRGNCY